MEMTVAAEYLLLLLERGSRGQESRPQRGTVTAGAEAWVAGSFSFLYLKQIKISKIYGRFEKFQNYTPVAPPPGGATGPKRKKKITFRSCRPGRIKQQTYKIDIKS